MVGILVLLSFLIFGGGVFLGYGFIRPINISAHSKKEKRIVLIGLFGFFLMVVSQNLIIYVFLKNEKTQERVIDEYEKVKDEMPDISFNKDHVLRK